MTLRTIACTFGDLINDEDVVNECVNQNLVGGDIIDPWFQINSCVQEEGDALMSANGELVASLTPQISHVPWVTVNSQHDPEAEDSLVNEICGYYYPTDKPEACQPKQLEVAIYYETNNTDVASFFLNQLSDFTEYLDEFAHFSFIPYGTTTNNESQLTCPNSDEQCIANAFHVILKLTFFRFAILNTLFYFCTGLRPQSVLQ